MTGLAPQWVHPEWLGWLLGALAFTALALGLAGLAARRRQRRLVGVSPRIANPALASDLALWLAAAAIAVALLGPRIGERVVRLPASGVDVVFALDVSRSMDAQDAPPSRLDRAKRAVVELLARLEPRDRAGLAAWAGGGVVLAPLTPDRGVLVELLSGVDGELIRPRSSDLAAGVRASLSAFETGSERPRVLVLLTDGEDPQRRGDLGAAEAVRAGVRVLPLAFGSEAGATIPDHGVPLIDRSGRTVVTRRDRERLAELARATDGAPFAADAWGAFDFDAVAALLRRDAIGVADAPGAQTLRRVPAVRVAPFAALAFALLLLEGLPRPRPVRRRRMRPLAVAGASLLLAPPSAGDRALDALPPTAELEARVRARPEDPSGLVALGAARLAQGRRDAAARAFLAAALNARDPQQAAVAYFDLGVAELEREDLEAAKRAFLDALAMDPGDERARFNLEWTLLALAQAPPPETAPQASPTQPESPEPEAEPEPPPVPLPDETASEGAPSVPDAPPPLSDAQQRRLLERVEDDPGRALRSAAREARSRGPAGDVVW